MLTVEELMKPRYKVIADYPGNFLSVGTIIVTHDIWQDFTIELWCQSNDKYPHLFKKLQWWEERAVEDMPEYVKCVRTPDQIIQRGEVLKMHWESATDGKIIDREWWVFPYTNFYIPAAAAEYEQYQQSKNK